MERIPMTAAGYKALEDEIQHLKLVERPAVIKGRVMDLEDKVSRADIIDVSKLSGKTVMFGATVTLADEDTDTKVKYMIVGDLEADAKKGRISISSPIARALIGKTAGDTVEVTAPGGARSYEILKVQFA